MKLRFYMMLILAAGFWSCRENDADYTDEVNVFVGTDGEGHTYPGASVPFGGVQLSPDTRSTGQESCGGYYYPDSSILGFSHTHLSGVGEPEYRDILFMPTVGKIRIRPGSAGNTASGYRSAFRHETESAGPGYYSVTLDDYHIKAELTATTRAGFHRYTYPATDSAYLVIDLRHPGGAEYLFIRKINDHEIEGLRRSNGWAWDQYVYFVTQFSQPMDSFIIAENGKFLPGRSEANGNDIVAVVNFSISPDKPLLVKTGISAVSTEGARLNLFREIPDWDFESIREHAVKSWNRALGKIEVKGGKPEQRRVFYTALYHAMLSPDVFMDVDGKYRGIDHGIHWAKDFTNYTVFSLWDTFRGLHPLFTILEPARTTDFIRSLLAKYRNGGRLPMWPLAGNYTDDMLGYHAVAVITDAYVKGIRNFNVEEAFRGMKQSANQDRLGLKYYKTMGFIPYDRQGESVSKTLEYCYDDWCIARMAFSLNKKTDYAIFNQRAHFYENVFDKTTGFMRARNIHGQWLAPFDPLINSAYSEGNAYQYMFVPHDVDGLITLMGGDKKFSSWLDTVFTKKSGMPGSIGQYNHGNEPSHHLAYLYNFTGQPWKTQALVHRILTELYADDPKGLAGNEDCGELSAWYILSAMGFYSVTPGQDIYVLGAPLFNEIKIHLENGNVFNVKAKNLSEKNIFVKSAMLNGRPLKRSYLTHEEIMNGSELVFLMDPEPGKDQASDRSERPFSNNGQPVTGLPWVARGSFTFQDSTTLSLKCHTVGAVIRYTTDGEDPTGSSGIYSGPLNFKKSSVLKMHAHSEKLLPSIVNSIRVRKCTPAPGLTPSDPVPGLRYDYFERFFVTTADLGLIKPVHSGIIGNFSIKSAPRESYFGYRFKGWIHVPSEGLYRFYLKSNDGSRLYIDDEELIENDGNHAMVEEVGLTCLKTGYHRIEIKYIQCGGGMGLEVFWEGPGFRKQMIPDHVLFH